LAEVTSLPNEFALPEKGDLKPELVFDKSQPITHAKQQTQLWRTTLNRQGYASLKKPPIKRLNDWF
jgi:hypothetical protein